MKDCRTYGAGGGEGGPPGQDVLAICLAALASVLGTPYLFELVGPFVEEPVYKTYDSRSLANIMYFVSFGLSGLVIFSITRMALWYDRQGQVARARRSE